jgi:hypothetical protein
MSFKFSQISFLKQKKEFVLYRMRQNHQDASSLSIQDVTRDNKAGGDARFIPKTSRPSVRAQ